MDTRTQGCVTRLQTLNECFKVDSVIQLKSRLPRRLSPSTRSPKIPKLPQCSVLAAWLLTRQGWGAGRELHRAGIQQPQMGRAHELNMLLAGAERLLRGPQWHYSCCPGSFLLGHADTLGEAPDQSTPPGRWGVWGNIPEVADSWERNSCK